MVKIEKDEIKLILSVLFSFIMLFFLVKSLNREMQIKQYLSEFSKKNQKIIEDNIEQEKLLKLYSTPQYKDLYAKENMNLLNQWEKVMIIKYNEKTESFLDKYLNIEEEDIKNMEVSEQWIEYFNLR